MKQANRLPARSEKGLLTPDNCVVAMIDLQPQMLFGVSNFDRQGLINNNVLLAKAARVFHVPVVLSTVETKSFSGQMWPQIKAVCADRNPIERTTMNSWDDANFVAAVEKTARKKIVVSGLWTETCVALATIQAMYDGYEVFVVEDCCGDVSQLAHDNAMRRMIQAGAKPVTALSVMLEWQRDWAERETYDAVMDIVKTHCGAYGVGVEYAYTMLHGAPETQWPAYVPVAAPLRTDGRMKTYLVALGAGALVGVIYGLLGVRSPAPPVVALIGLLGILVGEQVVPVVKRLASHGTVTVGWLGDQCAPHVFGSLPPALPAMRRGVPIE